MKPKRSLLSAAVVLALAAAPAHAVLERMGPVDKSPAVGGFPSWFQDKTGITMEFCDLKTQAELDGGWCVLIPPDGSFPETFPNAFFDEHFYYRADNGLVDTANSFRARLVIALESAFANGPPVDGDQMVFGRVRIFMPRLPFDGDYRVITPYSDVTYYDQKAGDRIFETLDIGIACINTFECALNSPIGPFLLPSPVAGGAEVPPYPDLVTAPPGTDPHYDILVAQGGTTPDPGTGKKYVADPGRVGPVTGSSLPNFIAYDVNGPAAGTSRNHNTFRVEVRVPSPTHDGMVFYTLDGETNFAMGGRLMTGSLPGNVNNARSTYKADAAGAVTDLDVFAQASPTVQARMPTQPIVPPVTPVISFYDQACGGALTVDPVTGVTRVNQGPYTAPAGTPHAMGATGSDFWGQSQPGGAPPSHACIEDSTSRNAAGQVIPSYYLTPVTDHVVISTAHYVGPENGTLTVNATSSDPTAVLTMAGYGPAAPATPGVSIGKGAGAGLELSGNAAQVVALKSPPSKVQVVSSKGGSALRPTSTAHGAALLVGLPSAVNDAATTFEDCSPTAATICAAGQSVTVDLLANDTVMLNGVVSSLRDVVTNNQATVTVTAQTPRLGMATVSADGILTYVPRANVNGTDNITYTVAVDGQASNQAVVAISITPVNDAPVSGSSTIGAVMGRTNVLNLLAGATDPDGNADVKDAVITVWPPSLGVQPTPANGVISFQPTALGNFVVNYQVKDAAGLLSGNTGAGTVTVIAAETITVPRADYRRGRWTVSGTDTVRANQQLTVAYLDGTLRATGQVCDGTATIPACVVGTTNVDGAGAFLLDFTGATGVKDPTATASWSTLPRNVRVFSSNPVLGGAQNAGIVIR
jgi:VCBS repeat-containing protein